MRLITKLNGFLLFLMLSQFTKTISKISFAIKKVWLSVVRNIGWYVESMGAGLFDQSFCRNALHHIQSVHKQILFQFQCNAY